MTRLTLPQLERHLFAAADILRGKMDAFENAAHPSFYKEPFFVPPEARWAHLDNELHHNIGDGRNTALGALEEANLSLEGVLAHRLQPQRRPVEDLRQEPARGRLYFHWQSILLPPRVVDHVVVHELRHLIEPHHTPAFWRAVERLLPDWERRQRWLAEHAHEHLL